jgi:hypothetical protein
LDVCLSCIPFQESRSMIAGCLPWHWDTAKRK